MDLEKKIKDVISSYIEEILLHSLTTSIDYRYRSDAEKTSTFTLSDLIQVYTQRFYDTFEQNKAESNIDNMSEILKEFKGHIGIISAMHLNDQDDIETMIENCINDVRDIYSPPEPIDVGTCCFCNGDCNPLSQSCGRCARGLSGGALGLPVPDDLKKYIHR